MANSDDSGVKRVKKMEINNRATARAVSEMTKTPRKSGAKSGFGSNSIKSKKGIMGKPRP